jgi:hypothetical protein
MMPFTLRVEVAASPGCWFSAGSWLIETKPLSILRTLAALRETGFSLRLSQLCEKRLLGSGLLPGYEHEMAMALF